MYITLPVFKRFDILEYILNFLYSIVIHVNGSLSRRLKKSQDQCKIFI